MATRRHKKDLVSSARKRVVTTPPAYVVQTSLDSFFGSGSGSTRSNSASKKRASSSLDDHKRHVSAVRNILASKSSSAFATCPICNNTNVPIHRLASHASQCNGNEQRHQGQKPFKSDSKYDTENTVAGMVSTRPPHLDCESASKSERRLGTTPCLPYTEPVPGLYLFENFLTEYEESQILLQLGCNHQLDPTKMNRDNSTTTTTNNSWKAATFNGKHYGQRWGVHCNLRTRQVLPEERSLPNFYFDYIMPKLHQLDVDNKISPIIKGYNPNEMNAIDYYKSLGHSLSAHVDDRHLSKEIIVNISLAGDCYMTFTPVEKPRASSSSLSFQPKVPIRVLLPRRCLQILTGPARYQYTHGIDHNDLLNERRVSLTLRESPITGAMKPVTMSKATSWITKARQHEEEPHHRKPLISHDFAVEMKSTSTGSVSWMKPVLVESVRPLSPSVSTEKTIVSQVSLELPPGLYIFPNFITEQEEKILLHQLDTTDSIPHWSIERHTGIHREKRWGVDHDIWSRQVREPIHPIPHWIESIIVQRLQSLRVQSKSDTDDKKETNVHDKFGTLMRSFGPNDVNAIEYKRENGHSLAAHIDDRQKHTEPIANLSLAGNCYMEYSLDTTKTKKKFTATINSKNTDHETAVRDVYRVHLPRRTLQILSGRARYDYRHGIQNSDLLTERRVSITLRETRP